MSEDLTKKLRGTKKVTFILPEAISKQLDEKRRKVEEAFRNPTSKLEESIRSYESRRHSVLKGEFWEMPIDCCAQTCQVCGGGYFGGGYSLCENFMGIYEKMKRSAKPFQF